jgi:hypothetical protein
LSSGGSQHQGGRRATRREIVGTIAFLLTVTAVFVAIAVASYYAVSGNRDSGRSPLAPLALEGAEETVFDHDRDACSPADVPDAPARAFRDAAGRIHLFASHYVTRAMVGTSLDHLRRNCRRVMVSALDPDPARFDDRSWLTSPYTTDGRTVHALVHSEYQGSTHPGQCSSAEPLKCWYNSITLARSTDGGRSFGHAPPPRQLVAAVPYRYEPGAGPYGLFEPSNIVRRAGDDHYYALIHAEGFGAQREGVCLMRSPRLDQPDAWRAWDGSGYGVEFVDPYEQSGTDGHVCTPVSYPEIATMTQSLTYNTYLRKYVLVGTAGANVPGKRGVVWGIYYSTSDDLLRWTTRRLVRETVLTSSYRCGDPDPVAYPSLIDPASRSRNFETTGRRPWLYFTRFHYRDCQNVLNRDLVRVRVRFSR